MTNQKFTRYVFANGNEDVADEKGKIVAFKNVELGEGYYPLKMIFQPYVQFSVNSQNSYPKEFNNPPKIGGYLVTARFLGFGQRISNEPISEINENFDLEARMTISETNGR